MTESEVARAFSGHRFAEAFGHLAADVVWHLPGQADLVGREAVIQACRASLADLDGVRTSWLRFVATGDGPVVAVDAIGRYAAADGTSTVSSADIYEFSHGLVTAITSYAVELDPDASAD